MYLRNIKNILSIKKYKLEKIFYYNYRKQAISPIVIAITMAAVGAFFHLILPNLIIITYFFYAFSLYFVFASIWFSFRPNKKYLVLTESNFIILTEKDCIDIPRLEILSVELCQSPIEFKARPNFRFLTMRDPQTVLKISLKSTCIDKITDYNYYKSDIENNFPGSQFVYISSDRKNIYLRLAPIEGFYSLLKLLKK
jgi:hypothetical protein